MTPDAEVLSVGGPRRPVLPHRGLVVAVLLLMAAGGGWQLLPQRKEPVAEPLPAVAPAPPVVADHLVLAEHTGAKLAMGGDSLLDVGLDDGYIRWTSLPGTTLEAVHVRSGDVLLVSATGDQMPAAVFVPTDRRGIVQLGPARALVAAADDGDADHVWLAPTSTATGALNKVDMTGRVVRRANLGARRSAVRETRYGMVTVSIGYFSSSLELWDIGKRKVAHVFWVAANFVVAAADAEHTAFTLPSCARPACPIKVAVIRTGEIFDVATPTGWATGATSFSPDGSRLAVVGRRVTRTAPDEPYLLVADLGTGAVRQVDGLQAGTQRSSLLAWSPDSRWFFVASDAVGINLLGYRLGDRRVRYAADARLRQMQPADVRSLSAY